MGGRTPDGHRRRRSRSRSRSASPNRVLWRAVRDDAHDFDAWTRLLQHVEQKNDADAADDAFDQFLRKYKFCFGYWKKWAELMRKHQRFEKALLIYERGVKEIPLSVDLWLSYIAYVKEIGAGHAQAAIKTRGIYVRALDACGLDWRSDKLWVSYLDWEVEQKQLQRAAQFYDLVLGNPTHGYQLHFERYKQFVAAHEPDQILNAEEYEAIAAKVRERLHGAPLFHDETVEEDVPPEEVVEGGATKLTVRRRRHVDAAREAFRSEILDRRSKLFRSNEAAVGDRLKFENAIKRPYFHVKPLDRDQLLAWHNYLDWEVGGKNKKRVDFLFRRCLVACALYEEFWIKCAAHYDREGDVERARQIYKEAAEFHCSRKPGLFLAYSLFEEKHGETAKALDLLNDFDRRRPGFVAITMRKLQVDRRRLAKEDKSADYSTFVHKMEKLIRDATNTRRVRSFYALKLARFQSKILHDRKAAERVLKEAIERDNDNLQLYLALVEAAFSSSHFREKDVLEALDFGLHSKHLSAEQRFLFSQRKLDVLEELGTSPGKLHDHYIEHAKLEELLDQPAPTLFSNLKRKNSDVNGETAEKKARDGAQWDANVAAAQPANFAVAPALQFIGNTAGTAALNGQSVGQFGDLQQAAALYSSPSVENTPGYQSASSAQQTPII
ncbi:hypothetical protein M3Y99_01088300 [Aphelenchoides fujianensis]|nr:hypothetical protein M3Y99_01088300 [Aphelenchoides fujianensis]